VAAVALAAGTPAAARATSAADAVQHHPRRRLLFLGVSSLCI
jgi:hypothetical protein